MPISLTSFANRRSLPNNRNRAHCFHIISTPKRSIPVILHRYGEIDAYMQRAHEVGEFYNPPVLVLGRVHSFEHTYFREKALTVDLGIFGSMLTQARTRWSRNRVVKPGGCGRSARPIRLRLSTHYYGESAVGQRSTTWVNDRKTYLGAQPRNASEGQDFERTQHRPPFAG